MDRQLPSPPPKAKAPVPARAGGGALRWRGPLLGRGTGGSLAGHTGDGCCRGRRVPGGAGGAEEGAEGAE